MWNWFNVGVGDVLRSVPHRDAPMRASHGFCAAVGVPVLSQAAITELLH